MDFRGGKTSVESLTVRRSNLAASDTVDFQSSLSSPMASCWVLPLPAFITPIRLSGLANVTVREGSANLRGLHTVGFFGAWITLPTALYDSDVELRRYMRTRWPDSPTAGFTSFRFGSALQYKGLGRPFESEGRISEAHICAGCISMAV